MRVVSLNCSNTEILWALGALDMLVAVDDDSDFPEAELTGLPRVGRDLDIRVDAVAALEPDLVLASDTVPGHERVLADLEAAGLDFYGPETITIADVYADIREIGARIGLPDRAEALVADMEASMPIVEADGRPTVMVHWWPKPVIAPGRRSWVTELIDRAGGRNPLDILDVKSTPLTDEEMAEIAPDIVAISWCGIRPDRYRPERVTDKPTWQEIPAVVDGRVHCIPEAYLGRPGPRLVDGYRALREIIAGP
ncbi:MAG TPA: ABC transporter substrate-binding protein [Acidimicrobiia bacterium]|nr:ABC transporter substrate-binding protein [Acidimicrobiia bacterium]